MTQCLAHLVSRITTLLAVSALLIAVAIPATAENPTPNPQPETPKPVLIVHATTPIENEGRPTLNLQDLESYFVAQLTNRGVANVMPFATAKIPDPPPPNMYLVDVSVDTMRLATRSAWNDSTHQYDQHDIFEVDLALAVHKLRVTDKAGTTGERHEHWFTPAAWNEEKRLDEKRAALYSAADNLALRFVNEWTFGKYGDALPATQAPSFMERAPWWLLLLISAAILLFLVIFFVITIEALFPPRPKRRAPKSLPPLRPEILPPGVPLPSPTPTVALPPPAPPPPPEPDAELDKYIIDVLAFAERSENFSDEWFESEARKKFELLLRDKDLICERHAKDVLLQRPRQLEHDRIARYGHLRWGLPYEELRRKIQAAKGYQYRQLTIAQRLEREAAAHKSASVPSVPPQPPDPEKVAAEHRAKKHQQELEDLAHEKYKKEKELAVEYVDRKIRDSQADVRGGVPPQESAEAERQRQAARRKAQEDGDATVDADIVASEVEQKKIDAARERCIRIFQHPDMLAGEKRAKIARILDSFNLELDILPLGIEELMENAKETEQ